MSHSDAASTFTLLRARRPSHETTHCFEVTVTQRNDALSAETHITVRDGWDQLKGEGYGNLKLDLPRGLYTLHLDRGGATHEEVVRHTAPNMLKRVEPMRSSAVPAYDTADAHTYYTDTANGLSLNNTRDAASVFGAQGPSAGRLFIFVRAAATGMHRGEDLAQTLFLYDLSGNRLTDFASEVVVRSEIDGWVGFSAPAPAGNYLLRHAGLEPCEMALTVFSGWETQLFVPFTNRPQLSRASMLLAHNGKGFRPDDHLAQAVDAGFAGLEDGVNLLPRDAQLLLDGKFDNPMLGLIGAHLRLLEKQPDWGLLETMIDNLEDILPGAADVQALRLALASRRGEKPPVLVLPMIVPPILRRGLDAILEASTVEPEIIPEGSIIERIAPHLLAYTPWSMWSLPVDLTGVESLQLFTARSTQPSMPAWVRRLLEDIRAKNREADLAAVARQAKLPLGMLRRHLAQLASRENGLR